jgi:hypothetical protein
MRAPRHNWAPIGQPAAAVAYLPNNLTPSGEFTGTFDGGGKALSNLWIDRGIAASGAGSTAPGVGFTGLFGCANGAEFRNIKITSGSVRGDYYTGGIAGTLGGASTVSRCSNYAAVTGIRSTGGIAGVIIMYGSGAFSDCKNYGPIQGDSYSGGIVASINSNYSSGSRITKCENYGAITAVLYAAGGIGGSLNSTAVEDCTNNGAVTAGLNTAGGIGAFSGGYSGCVNNGSVRVNGLSDYQLDMGSTTNVDYYKYSNAGGIVGTATGAISDCKNYGSVWAAGPHAGGIVGGINSSSPTLAGAITACFNAGAVTAGSDPGAGANAQGKVYAGGIAGRPYVSSITACLNTGEVRAKGNFAGGIVGRIAHEAAGGGVPSVFSLTACVNTGAVTAEGNYAGGIAGEIRTKWGNPARAIACFTTGVVTVGGSPVYSSTAIPPAGMQTVYNFATAGGITGGIQREHNCIYADNVSYWLAGGDVDLGNATRINLSSYHQTGWDEPNDPSVQVGTIELDSSHWPNLSGDWSSYCWQRPGDENTDGYWKSAGSWNGGGASIVRPRLYWEKP